MSTEMALDVTSNTFRRPSGRRTTTKTPQAQKSKFDKQREDEVIRNAHARGYLKAATTEAIWESIGEKCDLEDVNYLNLSRIHLHTVKSIDLCHRLKICVLHSNYLTSFDALGACRELAFLDLHSNQISKLPGHKFWAGLSDLQILYLHDNGISRLEYVQFMAASPSIAVLTLFNTPLSLKPNYRHHVVNSLWSLKALDHYVVSDEEIIEDASFGGRFTAMSPNFNIDPCCSLKKEHSSAEAFTSCSQLMASVNRIQARNCPVLIIQRVIRGYLTRQLYKYLQDLRIWAAVSIQRFYRHFKGTGGPLPPPSSPAPSRSSSALTRVDYDAYMRGVRPTLPPTPRESSRRIQPSSRTVSIAVEPIEKINEEGDRVSETRVTTSPVEGLDKHESFPVRITTRVTINLKSLETSTSDVIRAKERAVTVERNLGLVSSRSRRSLADVRTLSTARSAKKDGLKEIKSKELLKEEKRAEDREKKDKKKQQVGRFPTVQVFFGPIVQTHPRTEHAPIQLEDEPTKVRFRLSGLPSTIQHVDPLREMLISRLEAGRDVREASREHDRNVLNEPPKTVAKRRTTTTDQRLFLRTHGTMGLACLRAVQQAYRDREKAENLSTKAVNVAKMKIQREHAQERVKIYKQDFKDLSLRRRMRDGVMTAEALQKRESERLFEHERLNTARAVTAEHHKSRHADHAFVTDFACQQTSVSNALLRHDRDSQREEGLQEVIEVVQKEKESSIEQQMLVRRYMEHRQLMRQAETAMTRAEIESQLIREASHRVTAAKERVLDLKTRAHQSKEFYSVPLAHAPPQLPPLGVVSPDQMEVWDSLRKFDWNPGSHERSFSEPLQSPARRPKAYYPTYGLA